MILHKGLILLVGLALVVGCSSSKPKLSQLSGKVTFKVETRSSGLSLPHPRCFERQSGTGHRVSDPRREYDSSKDGNQGIPPGTYKVIIADLMA